ncbi:MULTISPECIES: DNA-binding domain-containing protein [Myxococcus]|uniref:HvfC/BufC N-terminal domain-containing protein n=1 Tax=Myxococcus TaxID=32 RepID=UPI001141A9A0|nr:MULTISPECIES: putative DNA-binding domain-containing protein [Myxococcus]MCK8500549.1 putative DNA-binding domain-containing protein [Myxococcus fulvus]
MKPELKHFFDGMGAYLAKPGTASLEQLYARHPGWDAPARRVSIYGDFVRGHVRGAVEKLYPLLRLAVGPEAWTSLVEGYTLTRPARHHEVNRLGESFPAFVADSLVSHGLPAHAAELARFEWTDFAVFSSQAPSPARVETLTPNPTLAVLEHTFRLCAHVRSRGEGGAPERGEELALLWRHPVDLVTYYQEATPPTLLVLKMAVEGLSASDVTAATGMPESDVLDAVARLSRDGLVLTPGG